MKNGPNIISYKNKIISIDNNHQYFLRSKMNKQRWLIQHYSFWNQFIQEQYLIN
jgi:hypothetical protein